ncbi:MAG: Crp/Fnr family transcriptional regulator [Bacteroidetes bacterium]|nr:Crp/Fnr family transcriptional regulator [Bacteroidota bacterium]
MEDQILAFINQNGELKPEEARQIARLLDVRSYPKGTVLLEEGEISRECFFILKGCIRKYHLVDGLEKTTAFYTEEEAAVSFTSYGQSVPADHFFACVEDCLLIVGTPEQEERMYKEFPDLLEFTRNIMQQDLGKTQNDLAAFISSSPEERYLKLLKNKPELVSRVPQHQLASYIGVTPESFSRIKKRLMKKA